MVWAGICLLLTGLVLTSIQGFGDGGALMVFGTGIPLGFEDPKPYVVQNLGRVIYSVVPAVILLGGFVPLGEWLTAGAWGERLRGLLTGAALAFVHGLVLGQLAILPILAVCYRLLGNPFAPSILVADLNALVLGLELLLWAAALGLLLKSNRGLAVLLAYGLTEIGKIMAWGGEFLGDLEVPRGVVATMAFLGKALPSGQLPADPVSWSTLPYGLGVPLALALLLLLLPAKGAKRSRA